MKPFPSDVPTEAQAWLVLLSGPTAGARYPLRGAVTRLGRSAKNDVVIDGEDASVVSSNHLEIRREGNRFRLFDLGSTNGTYVQDRRVSEAALDHDMVIRLGAEGPRFAFEVEEARAPQIEKTLVMAAPADVPKESGGEKAGTGISGQDEQLLSHAVSKARRARRMGQSDQTVIIMREVLGKAIDRSGKKFKLVIGSLVVILLALTGYGYWTIEEIKLEKSGIDQQIQVIEERLAAGGQDADEIEGLLDELEAQQRRARALQNGLLYRWGVWGEEQIFVQREIRALLKDFGAEVYSIPPEFVEQVKRFIEQYQTRDQKHVERALGRSREDLEAMRRIFEEAKLPPDLAYMALVESAFLRASVSRAGAVGPWQFTEATARYYGMKVEPGVDERHDLEKSTRAATRYMRELILNFGSGSSVMLALAAYNLGPTKVRRAVRRVEDPIKQRNFWYLYRVRALPVETREYVPKIIAAIIIGRNPERFGF